MYRLTIILLCIACIGYIFDYQVLAGITLGIIILVAVTNVVYNFASSKLNIIIWFAIILFAYQLFNIPNVLSDYIDRYHQCVDNTRNITDFKSFVVTDVTVKSSSHARIRLQSVDNPSMTFMGDVRYDRLLRAGIEIDANITAVKLNPTLFTAMTMLAQLSLLDQPATVTCQVHIDWWQARSLQPYIGWSDLEQERYKIKDSIFQSLLRYSADPHYAMMITAMTMGKHKALPEDIIDKFQLTGTIHLLVVSGLHTGILILVISYLIMISVRLPQPLYVWMVPLVTVSIFAWINSYSVSLLRVWLMLIVFCLQLFLFKRQWPLMTIGMPFLISLLFAPDDIFSPGFIMSYGLVAYIFILVTGVRKTNIFTLQAGISLWSIPLSAFAGLWYSPVAFLSNILAVPLFSVSLPFHFIAVIDTFVTGGSMIQLPSYWLHKLLLLWISWCAQLVTNHNAFVSLLSMLIGAVPSFAFALFIISRYLDAIPRLLGIIFLLVVFVSMTWSYSHQSIDEVVRSKTLQNIQKLLPLHMNEESLKGMVSISQNHQSPHETSIILQPSSAFPYLYQQFSQPDTSIWIKYRSARQRYYLYVDWFDKNIYEIQPQCNFLLRSAFVHQNVCESAAIFNSKWYAKGYRRAQSVVP